MLNDLTNKELLDWQRFMATEPLPIQQAEYRNALLCSILANVNRGKDQKPYGLKDFMMFEKEPDKSTETHEVLQSVWRGGR